MLSDPKRKRLYDDLGVSGLKLVETPSQVNPVELIKNFQVTRNYEINCLEITTNISISGKCNVFL